MGWIGHVRHEKLQRDFMAQTFALVRNVLPRVPLGNLTIPNAPKWYETHQNMSLGSNGWIGCIHCKKYRRDFVARTFALVRNVSPRVLQGNRMVANAPKRYEMHQNMSLRSNGVDRVLSLRKISMRLRGMKYCTSSARFAPSFVRQPNGPKCTQMVRNATKHEFRVQWGGSGAFVVKNSDATSSHEHLH